MQHWGIWIGIWTTTWLVEAKNSDVELIVHVNEEVGPLNRFWTSSGFSVPKGLVPSRDARDFYLSPEVWMNLALIGSLPNHGIEQVRIHWLLDLLTVKDNGEHDFAHLDQLIHHLWEFGLRPGFEIMGNPGGSFSNLEEQTQIMTWKWMVEQLGRHYVQRYGLDEVAKWNFETWNEPDHHDFDGLNLTVQGYLNYFDATWQGLKDVHPTLKLGGPGGACRGPHFTQYCHALLTHCQNGTNIFSGKSDLQLAFVSIHQKGNKTSKSIAQPTLERIREIQSLYPKLRDRGTPFMNNEGDPEKSWWKPRAWRTDVRYPAMVVSNILTVLDEVMTKNWTRFQLLSNDNAFLNTPPLYFEQRTLLTIFTSEQGHSEGKGVLFLEKPVFNVMAMMALLGDKRLKAELDSGESTIKALATKSRRGVSVLLVRNVEEQAAKGTLNCRVRLAGLRSLLTEVSSAKFVVYKLTNKSTNPFGLWERLGRPQIPSDGQMQMLWHEASLKRGPIKDLDRKNIRISLPGRSIKLLQICHLIEEIPSQPTGLKFHREAHNRILITWRYDSHAECLKGFQVYFAKDYQGNYEALIEEERLAVMNFVHLGKASHFQGWFRVTAIDLWDRPGASSVQFFNPLVQLPRHQDRHG